MYLLYFASVSGTGYFPSSGDRIKGKVFYFHSMKAYRGSRGIAPLISNLGPLCLEMVNFMPRPLYSGN
jgi:hypothetical protein